MNPVILANNVLSIGTITADETAPGNNVLNLADYRTYTFWKANTSGTHYITLELPSLYMVDSLAIVNHNLYSAQALITVEADAGVGYQAIAGPFTAGSNNAFMKTFNMYEADKYRIKIVTSSMAPFMAVVFLGKKVEFPIGLDAPFKRVSQSLIVNSDSSKTGHFLGADVRQKPFTLSARFTDISRSFVDQNVSPLWDGDMGSLIPFFFAWDLTNSSDVYYVRLSKEYKYELPISRGNYYDSLTLDMEGSIR